MKRNWNTRSASKIPIPRWQSSSARSTVGASLRYLSQRYAMPYPELSAILTDIGTEAAEVARGAQIFCKSDKKI